MKILLGLSVVFVICMIFTFVTHDYAYLNIATYAILPIATFIIGYELS